MVSIFGFQPEDLSSILNMGKFKNIFLSIRFLLDK